MRWSLHTTELVPDVLDCLGAATRRIAYLSSIGIDEDAAEQADPITGSHATVEQANEAAIGDAIGRPIGYEELPRDSAHEFLVGLGWPAPMADGALDAWANMVEHPESVLPTVEQITGKPARTFAQWAADHADDFR